ncbi:MAG: ZinT/AdcA family metal-binding protein, partial [Spirochaetaceae bacterium]|nr:ZinT/AdcA family metal-binding protein [Spirochaetaceae bacterium]
LPPAAESHSFEPTPQDIIRVRNSALFIYIGGESDAWVDYILDSMPTESMRILPLMDKVDVVEELVVEGMQDEEEGHDHGHNSSIFEDRDIRDRPTLGDWEGEWQSGYPYVVNGALEEVFEHKAEDDDSKTAAEYKQYYLTGYRTNYDRLVIRGDRITWYTGQRNVTVQYRYRGYAILDYGDGERGVRYQFEAAGPTNGAPRYLQFSDHNIGPTADLHHFHVYYGDDGFEPMLENLVNWPTYYPADWGAAEIAADMIGHDHGEGEAELDEHIWTSPRNAITLVEAITEALSEADPANAEFFRQNAAAYTAQLRALDAAFREVVNQASRRTIILGDRFPFRYFADAYGLSYFAAFPGCSTETEASAATIAFLINKVRDERIPVVFHIELSNERITDTICEATGARKLLLHSAHNITKRDFERGVTYLELQQANVGRLREALR